MRGKVTHGIIQRVKELRSQGLSYQRIARECGISVKTAYYIVKGEYERVRGSILNNVELTNRAIELIDRGEVKDPTDLVRIMKIPLPDAITLFKAIAEARKLNTITVLEESKKLYNDLVKLVNQSRLDFSIWQLLDEFKLLLNEIKFRLNQRAPCKHMDKDGYCTQFTWGKSTVPGFFTTKDLGNDRCTINVRIHKGICAVCKSYEP